MDENHELEDLLESEHEDGQLDSHGEFKLDKKKALDKFARHALPRSSAWILKILQGIVACKAPALDIKFGKTSVTFIFEPATSWSTDACLASFYELESPPGWQDVKRGLWSVGVQGERHFTLSVPSEPDDLVWDGHDFSRAPKNRSHRKTTLEITYPSPHSIWDQLKGADPNLELLQELRNCASVYPLPLWLDQGTSNNSIARLSDSVVSNILRQPPRSVSLSASWEFVTESAHATVPNAPPTGCFIASHYHEVWSTSTNKSGGTSKTYKGLAADKQESCLLWLVDGIIVKREVLAPPHSVSCTLICSGAGLKTDLSGLALIEDEAYTHCRRAVLTGVRRLVEELEIDFSNLVEKAQQDGKRQGVIFMLVGIPLILAAGLGLLLIAGGAYTLLSAGTTEAAVGRKLTADLAFLQKKLADLTSGDLAHPI